ncbi:MAG TPA: Ig-like domain-containing protein [Candidatus Dormibacteraeota bacterium]|nr:Ig-like domain-containing protein [Candidatus Dormibacteraeota bacterium]
MREPWEEPEFREVVSLLESLSDLEAMANPAFRMTLRRRLLTHARRQKPPLPWYRRFTLPMPLALASMGAATCAMLVVLIAVTATHGGQGEVRVASPLDHSQTVSPTTPITLTFSKPMDRQATEEAIQIQPPLQVSYAWTSATTLQIIPSDGTLAPHTHYSLVVGTDAQTADHKPLSHPVTISFVTGQPEPSTAVPSPPSSSPTPQANPSPSHQPSPSPTPQTSPSPTPSPTCSATPTPQPSPSPSAESTASLPSPQSERQPTPSPTCSPTPAPSSPTASSPSPSPSTPSPSSQ